MKTLGAPFEIKELSDSGSFEGIASTYGNVDLGGDIVEPGAFKEMVLTKDGKIRVLAGHDTRAPIGKGIVTDTHVGLAIKGQINLAISRARDTYEMMKDGVIDGLSIGFDIRPGGAQIREDGVRLLKDLKLWEVSLVTFPMNPSAQVSAVKSIPQFTTIRECEVWLRDELGLSNSAAKEFVARFKQALITARDEPPRDEGLQADLKNTLAFLQSVAAPQ